MKRNILGIGITIGLVLGLLSHDPSGAGQLKVELLAWAE